MSSAQNADRFVNLFTRHAREIYLYVRGVVPNHADCEDIFQETSRVLWEKFDQYEPGTDFRAWAFEVARFEMLNFRRTKARDRVFFSEDVCELLAGEAAGIEDEGRERRLDALRDCYEKLTPKDQQIVETRYGQGAKAKEAAEKLGQSIHSVYRSLSRIHWQLFKCIQRRLSGRDNE